MGRGSEEATPAYIERHVEYDPFGGCWLWSGTLRGGYGVSAIGGKARGAHRLAWSIFNGEAIPDGMIVCHRCDVPSCVNPGHLFIGTHADNRWDCVSKGRANMPRGQKARFCNLTEDKVLEIAKALCAGQPVSCVAKAAGCSYSAVRSIQTGRTWHWLTGMGDPNVAAEIRAVTRRGAGARQKRPPASPIVNGKIQCRTCGETNFADEFYRDPQSVTGFKSECKKCSRRRQRNIDQKRKSDR